MSCLGKIDERAAVPVRLPIIGQTVGSAVADRLSASQLTPMKTLTVADAEVQRATPFSVNPDDFIPLPTFAAAGVEGFASMPVVSSDLGTAGSVGLGLPVAMNPIQWRQVNNTWFGTVPTQVATTDAKGNVHYEAGRGGLYFLAPGGSDAPPDISGTWQANRANGGFQYTFNSGRTSATWDMTGAAKLSSINIAVGLSPDDVTRAAGTWALDQGVAHEAPAPWDFLPVGGGARLGALGIEEGASVLRGFFGGTATREAEGAAANAVWKLNPLERGQQIEQALGHNLPSNFPVIDRFEGGVATSIKSLDLNVATYQNAATLDRTLSGYVDKVADFQGRTWAGVRIRPQDVSGRALDLVVPRGATGAQQSIINRAVTYGASRGVTVNVVPYP